MGHAHQACPIRHSTRRSERRVLFLDTARFVAFRLEQHRSHRVAVDLPDGVDRLLKEVHGEQRLIAGPPRYQLRDQTTHVYGAPLAS